jgi:hypothetical protein
MEKNTAIIQKMEHLFKRLEQKGTDTPERRKAILDGIAADRQALDSPRHTYNTGEPVVMSEFSHTSRYWINDGNVDLDRITPLSPLHNYTIRYDRDKNEMHYYDYYDFNRFEDFVPGEPFTIKGSIKLKK